MLKQSRVISAVEHYLGGPVEPAEADQVVGICNSLCRLQEDDISIIAYNRRKFRSQTSDNMDR